MEYVNSDSEKYLNKDQYFWLFKIAGISALISAVLIPIAVIVFFIWPLYPEDILEIIQRNMLAGLMSLDVIYSIGNIFALPIFLAFYIILRKVDKSFSLIALSLGIISLVLIIPARPIVEMIQISENYSDASTQMGKEFFKLIGMQTMKSFRGTAYYVHYVSGTLSLLISSVLMLNSDFFKKNIAYIGIISNILVFGFFIPKIGTYISLISVIGYLIWWMQVYKRMMK